MSFRKRTAKELEKIYIGFPEDMMGCDDEEDSEKVQGWVSCVLDFGRIERRKCAYLGTDKCPHKQSIAIGEIPPELAREIEKATKLVQEVREIIAGKEEKPCH